MVKELELTMEQQQEVERQLGLISRGAEEIIPEEEFKK